METGMAHPVMWFEVLGANGSKLRSSRGKTWTLAAWCELRTDFRNFRLDRMADPAALDDRFTDEPGRTLKDMLEQYGPEAVRLLDR
jgi:hypothetical protein